MGGHMRVNVSRERAAEIFSAAIQDGDPLRVTRLGFTGVKWDVSHKCTDPIDLQIMGYDAPSFRWLAYGKSIGQSMAARVSARDPLLVDMAVRCRRCTACLRVRSAMWRYRAETELFNSERTWFGTMTLNPTEQHRALSLARRRAAREGEDFEKLSTSEQFRKRVSACSPEITKFLKRVRKNSGAKFRYLLVAEAHKSGAPHFHMLLHERAGERVSWQNLSDAWQKGFSKFKLAKSGSGPFDETDRKVARYVCKYLAKSALARVRASARYGEAGTVLNHSDSVTTTINDDDRVTEPETGPGLEKADTL